MLTLAKLKVLALTTAAALVIAAPTVVVVQQVLADPPPATTQAPPAPQPRAPVQLLQENLYYIAGDVERVGVYSMDGRSITPLQAIIAAGGRLGFDEYYLEIIRQKPEEHFAFCGPLSLLTNNPDKPPFYLQASDVINVFSPESLRKRNEKEAIIRPHDRLNISVNDLIAVQVRSTFDIRVSATGHAQPPLIRPVLLSGKTLEAAAADLTIAYRQANLLTDAGVQVEITETGMTLSTYSRPFHPGDWVRVSVADLEGMGKLTALTQQLNNEGILRLPPDNLPLTVDVAGLTELETIDAIVKAYRDANILILAQVSVIRLSPKEAQEP